jgi:hypothetical protein
LRPTQVLYVRRSDTIDLLREALRTAAAGAQVWVVVPWGWSGANNLIRLKLLKRAADAEALDLRLVSRHLNTRALARMAGIPVRFFVPFGLRRLGRRLRPKAGGLSARLVSAPESLGARWRKRSRPLGVGAALLSMLTILSLIAAMAVVAAAYIPSATIRLEPVAESTTVAFRAQANTRYREVDFGQGVIPARVVQVIIEGLGDTPASGSLYAADGQASGQVVFANRTSNAVVVPKGTVVRTGSGNSVRFYTVADVELPAMLYGITRVGVIAAEPGYLSNVKELTINVVEGDVAHLVEVINDAPTRGGSVKRVPIVAYQDYDRLRHEMVDRLQKEGYEQVVAELTTGEFVPFNSLETLVMSETFDQVVDQRSDVLSMVMRVVVRGIAVDGQGLEDLATQFLRSKAGEGSDIIEDSLLLRRSDQVQIQDNVLSFDVTALGVMGPIIDVASLKAAIRGRELAEAQQWLTERLPLRHEAQIELFPDWWERMPWLPGRIKVLISAGT